MTKAKQADRLSPENLMNYHLSVSLVDKLYDVGEITAREKAKMLTILGINTALIRAVYSRRNA